MPFLLYFLSSISSCDVIWADYVFLSPAHWSAYTYLRIRIQMIMFVKHLFNIHNSIFKNFRRFLVNDATPQTTSMNFPEIFFDASRILFWHLTCMLFQVHNKDESTQTILEINAYVCMLSFSHFNFSFLRWWSTVPGFWKCFFFCSAMPSKGCEIIWNKKK